MYFVLDKVCHLRYDIVEIKKRGETMSMTAFILIVGLALLTMAAINEAIRLLNWLYEQDQRRKRTGGD